MANGEIFREIKEILKDNPNSLTIEARDRLVLEGIVQLHERIDTMAKQTIRVTTSELQKIEKHDITLYGDDKEDGGLVKDVKDIKNFITDFKADMRKAMWSILAPVFAIIGVGIIALVVVGATIGK